MILSVEEFINLRTSDDPDVYQRAANDTAPEDVWLEIIDKYQDMRRWVAHNKTIPYRIIQVLANDPDPLVRYAIASKRRTSPDILEALAQDFDEIVRRAVVSNAKTPMSVLEILANDNWKVIADIAQERIKTFSA